MKTYQPEYALISREIRKENGEELANVLAQIAIEGAARLPPPQAVALEAQFRRTVHQLRQDVQRARDVQAAHILRWLRS